MPQRPARLRKQYTNLDHPLVVLRFEDGHEIRVPRGAGRAFDAWSGETIRIVVEWDPSAADRELLETRRADAFDDAD